MEKLQLHLPISGQIKFPALHSAVENEGLPVHIVPGAIKVRRSENISPRHPTLQHPLRIHLIGSVNAPNAIGPNFPLFRKGLCLILGIHRAGADENIRPKAIQSVQKPRHIRACVGGDVKDPVKRKAPQAVSQVMPVRLHQRDPFHLGTAVPVQHRNSIAPPHKIFRRIPADKIRPSGDQKLFHSHTPFLPIILPLPPKINALAF